MSSGSTLGKVTLDLDRMVDGKKITSTMAQMLQKHATPRRQSNYLVSTLYILGALAAAIGVVLLKPAATTGLIIGLVCMILGLFIRWKNLPHLNILSLALGIGSAAGLIGWFALEFGDTLSARSINGFAALTILVMAILFRSKFLAALVPPALAAVIGTGAVYWHASYGIFVHEPALTVLLFTALSGIFYVAYRKLAGRRGEFGSMSLVAARMSLILVNLGFWVGSLWGDYVGDHLSNAAQRQPGQGWAQWRALQDSIRELATYIPSSDFAAAWALFAIGMIGLGSTLKQRFIAICGVVFLSINAFTQYFETLFKGPEGLILGGIALVTLSIVLASLNSSMNPDNRENASSPS